MTDLSVLDLSPIVEGSDASQSLANSLDLARHAERLGYKRYWLAEHHNMPGIASAATAVVIAHVAGGTRTIRVGAGGIMLPNHSPLVIAEQFGTLAALHPGRIDLGLGRAPRHRHGHRAGAAPQPRGRGRQFPAGRRRADGLFPAAEEGQRIRAVPARARTCRSGFSAPASTAPNSPPCLPALCVRLAFRAGGTGQCAGYLPLALPAVGPARQAACHARPQRLAAPTDAEARLLFTSLQQAFVNLRTGKARKTAAAGGEL